jgi:NADH-quinone oxidoreductase subunit A
MYRFRLAIRTKTRPLFIYDGKRRLFMLFDFFTVAIFTLVGIAIVFALLLVPFFFAPKHPSEDKQSTYECGERVIAPSWIRFNMRFFFVAIVFLIFDAEIAFMVPVATVYKNWVRAGYGVYAFVEIAVFVLILLTGLVYIWVKGDLGWVKDVFTGPAEKD